MFYSSFVGLILTQYVCGAVEYSPFQRGANIPGVDMREQNTRRASYTAQQQTGEPVRYAQFPETFPNHHDAPPMHQYHQPYGVKPSQPYSGQLPDQVPYGFRPSGPKQDQVTDHHFLTRPQSVVFAPMGMQYLPHRLGPQLHATNLDQSSVQPFSPQMPSLGYGKPGLTLIAKNIFIQNENPQTYSGVTPFGRIEYREKPGLHLSAAGLFKSEIIDSKSSLLNRLLASTYPREIILNNKLEIIDNPTPHRPFDYDNPGMIHQISRPLNVLAAQVRPLAFQNRPSGSAETVNRPYAPPFECKFSNCFPQAASLHISNAVAGNNEIPKSQTEEKETANKLTEFHPLLSPVEAVNVKPDKDNITEKAEENGKLDYEKTMVTITTNRDKTASEQGPHEEILTSVEALRNETED